MGLAAPGVANCAQHKTQLGQSPQLPEVGYPGLHSNTLSSVETRQKPMLQSPTSSNVCGRELLGFKPEDKGVFGKRGQEPIPAQA